MGRKSLGYDALPPEPREPPLTPRQAAVWIARLLGKPCSPRMVQYLCERGAVPCMRLGSRWLLWPSELIAWVNSGGLVNDEAASTD
jgi:hypothetical protein